MKPRILFALPGLHNIQRGAEVALERIGAGLCAEGFEVTLMGTGEPIPARPYQYIQGRISPRTRFEHWPKFPPLRSEYRWEELSFVPSIFKHIRPQEYDLTVTCSYPFVNWALRMRRKRKHPLHIFITENGDWPVCTPNREYRFFGCEGLVCTNPEYYDRNRASWPSALIPNGVDTHSFTPGPRCPEKYGIPADAPVVCMVSALIPSKFPEEGIRAVAALEGVHLLIAGNGPLRDTCDQLGNEVLGDRYHRITVPMDEMPQVYRTGHIFLHLSRDEAFGNIYIEAASCAVPVVAHETPTTRWILGEGGHLLNTSNRTTLQQTLSELLKNPPSAASLSHTRERMLDRFDWPVVCKQYATFFRKLLEA
jgi:glycosyltransferase involved in cell wall biosynthesis